jgi:uncharacterized membrane protein YeaQ/YmgE (transglycosylase-associated protein family)
MEILSSVLVGLVAGVLVSVIVGRVGFGVVGDILLGIAGALASTYMFAHAGWRIAAATAGAVVVLVVAHVIHLAALHRSREVA